MDQQVTATRLILVALQQRAASTRPSIEEPLSSAGFRLVFVDNSITTRLALSDQTPDLIIVNCVFPIEESDLRIADVIREAHRTSTIPIILLSGELYAEVINTQSESLRMEILRKPFTEDDLLAAVRRWLATPR